jgi:hypothetical protein
MKESEFKKPRKSELEVLKIEGSALESELSCTDSTALVLQWFLVHLLHLYFLLFSMSQH